MQNTLIRAPLRPLWRKSSDYSVKNSAYTICWSGEEDERERTYTAWRGSVAIAYVNSKIEAVEAVEKDFDNTGGIVEE